MYLTTEKKLAPGSITIAVAALRFLYKVTLKKTWSLQDIIPVPKKPQTLPALIPCLLEEYVQCSGWESKTYPSSGLALVGNRRESDGEARTDAGLSPLSPAPFAVIASAILTWAGHGALLGPSAAFQDWKSHAKKGRKVYLTIQWARSSPQRDLPLAR